jgi:hypothetical protein
MNITNSDLPVEDVLFLKRIISWNTTAIITKRVASLFVLFVTFTALYVFISGIVYGTDDLTFKKIIHFIFGKSELWQNPYHQGLFAQCGVFAWELLFRLPQIIIAWIIIVRIIIFKIAIVLKENYSIEELTKINNNLIDHVKQIKVTERQVDMLQSRLKVLLDVQKNNNALAIDLENQALHKKQMSSSLSTALSAKIDESNTLCRNADREVLLQQYRVKKKEILLSEKLFLREGIIFIGQLISALKAQQLQNEHSTATVAV